MKITVVPEVTRVIEEEKVVIELDRITAEKLLAVASHAWAEDDSEVWREFVRDFRKAVGPDELQALPYYIADTNRAMGGSPSLKIVANW